jgi:hypothetical protein
MSGYGSEELSPLEQAKLEKRIAKKKIKVARKEEKGQRLLEKAEKVRQKHGIDQAVEEGVAEQMGYVSAGAAATWARWEPYYASKYPYARVRRVWSGRGGAIFVEGVGYRGGVKVVRIGPYGRIQEVRTQRARYGADEGVDVPLFSTDYGAGRSWR